jgi:hypothetical protein
MKFEIHIFHNQDLVKVVNLSEESFHYKNPTNEVLIEPKQSKAIKKGLAQYLFGNWEKKDEIEEITRRKNQNITHFETTIVLHEKEEKIVIEEKETEQIAKIRPEFADISISEENDEEVPSDENKTEKLCIAMTKSGKPCKGKAQIGDYCLVHKP